MFSAECGQRRCRYLPMSTPEKWMSVSSPIITSSMSLQWPSFTSSGWSKVDAISPPDKGNNSVLTAKQQTQ